MDQGEEHARSNCREDRSSDRAEADDGEKPAQAHEGEEEEERGDGAGDAAAAVIGENHPAEGHGDVEGLSAGRGGRGGGREGGGEVSELSLDLS